MAPTDRTRTPADDGNTAKLAVASGVGAPPLTVWLGSAMYTFPVGRDVIVGRDRDCDIRFQDINPDDLTLISRVHAILRFDGARIGGVKNLWRSVRVHVPRFIGNRRPTCASSFSVNERGIPQCIRKHFCPGFWP